MIFWSLWIRMIWIFTAKIMIYTDLGYFEFSRLKFQFLTYKIKNLNFGAKNLNILKYKIQEIQEFLRQKSWFFKIQNLGYFEFLPQNSRFFLKCRIYNVWKSFHFWQENSNSQVHYFSLKIDFLDRICDFLTVWCLNIWIQNFKCDIVQTELERNYWTKNELWAQCVIRCP